MGEWMNRFVLIFIESSVAQNSVFACLRVFGLSHDNHTDSGFNDNLLYTCAILNAAKKITPMSIFI